MRQADPTAKVMPPSLTWGARRYYSLIPYIDRETGKVEIRQEHVSPTNLAAQRIPSTPSHCNFERLNPVAGDQKFRTPSERSEQTQHQAARDLCRCLSWKLYGLITSKTAIVQQALQISDGNSYSWMPTQGQSQTGKSHAATKLNKQLVRALF